MIKWAWNISSLWWVVECSRCKHISPPLGRETAKGWVCCLIWSVFSASLLCFPTGWCFSAHCPFFPVPLAASHLDSASSPTLVRPAPWLLLLLRPCLWGETILRSYPASSGRSPTFTSMRFLVLLWLAALPLCFAYPKSSRIVHLHFAMKPPLQFLNIQLQTILPQPLKPVFYELKFFFTASDTFPQLFNSHLELLPHLRNRNFRVFALEQTLKVAEKTIPLSSFSI